MNFDQLLSGYKTGTCVMSVEKMADGGYGNIRIVAGNKAHCDDMLATMHRPFIPNSPYAEYLPENKNFEDYCYRAAILGQPLHAYVELPQMGLWLNMFLLPLESDQENVGYCIYSYHVTPKVDTEQRASLSADNAAAVLETCIKLRGSRNIRQTFNEVIEDIRQICDSDQCCILLTDAQERKCTTLCESIRQGCGLLPMDTYLNDGFYDIMLTWDGTLGDSTCIIIKDERDMEWLKSINPVWHDSLSKAGVKSIVLFPLSYNDVTLGYMWGVNFNVNNTVKIKETLELTTFFIAAEIANHQLLQRLEILGSMDLLTGVKNRNKMNALIDDVIHGRTELRSPYAVIFADLNGLKHVNDANGHGMGDELLKSAARILRKCFREGDVYRAGGDEFMIIAEEMDEAQVKEKVKYIKEQAAAEQNLFFAIGTHVVRDGEDIRQAMRLADEGMYADKKEYYSTHPDRRYR